MTCLPRTAAALVALLVVAGARAQIDVVRVDGTATTLSAARLAALPRLQVEATANDRTRAYEGSDLRELLAAAQAGPTAGIGGALLRRVVTVHGGDGYVAAFALAEIDPTLGAKTVLVVDREDGAPLAVRDAPWKLVVPSERRPTRWVRGVVRIVVTDAP